VRIWFPVGYVFNPLEFQIAHFCQYITLFVLGILAFRNNWLEQISYRLGLRCFIFAQLFIFVGFPLLFIAGGAASGNIDPFMGGMTWQSLGYAIWEQLVGFAIIIGLLGIFREKLNKQSRFMKTLSAAAFVVYIIHPVVLVACSVAIKQLEIYHLYKFIILSPIAVVLCFALAIMLRKIPVVNRIV
jgi:surface polysaccharide O-acyltransferase-like enzyme